MCGIVGIFGQSVGAQSDRVADKISSGLDSIARRGPDGQGRWRADTLALGHVRLAIIDPETRSDQPMESDHWVLCYNGEIYNFRDIAEDLRNLGHTFKTRSDTEVLLLGLEQWGIEGCLSRIAGMFAFIAHNKTTGDIFVARDHMGIKPVLYAHGPDGTAYVASSVAAIRSMCSEHEFRISPSAIGQYMALGGAHGEQTCYEGIKRLAPGHYMQILPGGQIRTRQFWEPEYQIDFRMDDLISIAREYQIADVKSALFLSGGVDSSFLASIYGDMDCFHLISPEESYARMVADRFDRRLISVHPELDTYEADVEAATAFHGEPMMSVGIPLAVSREVKRYGYKMAISANGADELFLGYARTPMPEHMPAYLPLHETASNRFMIQQLQHIFRDCRNFEMRDLAGHLPSMRDLYHDCLKRYRLPGFPVSASHRWTELMTYVLSDLNPTLDAASMFNSVEVRVPFLDHRIVQGVLSWDASELVTPELGRKAPLKQHLAKYFPQTLYQRKKLGFSIHSEKLQEISSLGENALRKAQSDGRVTLRRSSRHGQYERDMIYLGSSLFGLSKWDGAAQLSSLSAN